MKQKVKSLISKTICYIPQDVKSLICFILGHTWTRHGCLGRKCHLCGMTFRDWAEEAVRLKKEKNCGVCAYHDMCFRHDQWEFKDVCMSHHKEYFLYQKPREGRGLWIFYSLLGSTLWCIFALLALTWLWMTVAGMRA